MGLTSVSYGQSALSGTVTDTQNQPLAGVSIYAPHLQKATLTDDLGHYEFARLPSGQVRLVISLLGYTTQNAVVDTRVNTTLNISLTENVHQMDEVVVSTAFSKLQSQNVVKVERETLQSLQQKGAVTLADGLSTIPGVSQISTGASIGKPVIRGLGANRVLVYAQGVRLENQQFGDEHGLGLNDSGIESVEVIKGPASLLYGSDALGGVLYINPEKFAASHTFQSHVNQRFFSNTSGSSTSLGVKGSTENWKFLARGSHAFHADYKVPDSGRVANTRYNESDFKTGIGYSDSKFSSVLRYNFNRLDLGIPEDGFGSSKDIDPAYPKQAVDNHIIGWHNNIFFAHSTLEANFGWVSNDRREFEDSHAAALHMKLNTFNYDIKYHFPIGRVETIVGTQGMHQTNRNFGGERLIPDAATTDFGLFATTHYQWRSNVIQAGIRYDNRILSGKAFGEPGEDGYFADLDRTFGSFNASLGYKADLAQGLTVRANIASGFRAPNLAELTSNGVHEGTNRFEIGNAQLHNEQNYQADLNLEYESEHFELFANGFYNHINRYIYASPTGILADDHAVFAYTQADARLYGGEAGAHFHPHPLDWLHLESSFSTVTGNRTDGQDLPLVPANVWSNTLRTEFHFKRAIENAYARVNVTTTFDQDRVGAFETASDGYNLLNAGIGVAFRIGKSRAEASLTGNNLLDKRYIAHLSRLKNDGIPNIGRNIVFGFQFHI